MMQGGSNMLISAVTSSGLLAQDTTSQLACQRCACQEMGCGGGEEKGCGVGEEEGRGSSYTCHTGWGCASCLCHSWDCAFYVLVDCRTIIEPVTAKAAGKQSGNVPIAEDVHGIVRPGHTTMQGLLHMNCNTPELLEGCTVDIAQSV